MNCYPIYSQAELELIENPYVARVNVRKHELFWLIQQYIFVYSCIDLLFLTLFFCICFSFSFTYFSAYLALQSLFFNPFFLFQVLFFVCRGFEKWRKIFFGKWAQSGDNYYGGQTLFSDSDSSQLLPLVLTLLQARLLHDRIWTPLSSTSSSSSSSNNNRSSNLSHYLWIISNNLFFLFLQLCYSTIIWNPLGWQM